VCVVPVESFASNPQYHFEVVDPDENDDDDKGTVLIALMQHEERKRKNTTVQLPLLTISYSLFKVRNLMFFLKTKCSPKPKLYKETSVVQAKQCVTLMVVFEKKFR